MGVRSFRSSPFRRTSPAMKMRRLERLCLATTLTLVCAHKAYLLGQAPQAQPDLRAAASAEKSGRYEEAATLYQRFLSGIESSKTNPSLLVEVRTRLATAYFLLHRYRESLEAVAPLTSNKSRYARERSMKSRR